MCVVDFDEVVGYADIDMVTSYGFDEMIEEILLRTKKFEIGNVPVFAETND